MKKVREGYKITELGEIPIEWEIKKMKDLGKSLIGLTYSPDDLVYEGNGTLVLRSSNIRNNRIVFDDNKYVNKDIQEKLIVKENDILICSRNGSKDLIGKCALIDKKAEGSSFGAFMTIYRSKYNKYLFNVFTSYMFKRQIYNNLGATINQITTDNLNNFKVILPTKKEQEKIACILSTVDEQIDNVDRLIKKNMELKKGLMQQLLTKGIGHTKFKKTEIGEIPEAWEVKKLGEVFKLSSGNFLSQKNIVDGTYPVYGGNGITGYHNEFLFNDSKIVIGRVGAKCGCVCISEPNAWITDNALYISEKIEIFNDKYMYYLLDNINLNSHANQNAQPVISGQKIYSIDIGFPNIKEQEKIVSILSKIDEKIEEYENKKQKLEELKKGLMQQLLTGKIRVNNI